MGFGDQSRALNGNGATSIASRQSLVDALEKSNFEGSLPTRLRNYCELPYERQASLRKFEEKRLEAAAEAPTKLNVNATNDATGASDENVPGAMIANLTATSFVSKIHAIYMQTGQDIKWRLGAVTKTLDDARHYLVKNSNEGLTDKNGFIYTQVDTFQKHRVSNDYTETYVNFFFPPYSKSSIEGIEVTGDLSLQEAINNKEIEKEITKKRLFGGKGQFYDPESSIDYRGNFTFRSAGYKSVNDSVSYLQYLFERVSGIVSTYLTEWDLSIYQQESLVTENNKDFKSIPLTYRMKEDSPLNTILSDADVPEDAYKTFGVINCAVSKLNNDPSNRWHPDEYIYSNNWTTIPRWVLLKSQYKKTKDKHGNEIKVPEYYEKVLNISKFLEGNPDVKARILFDDYQGMALAGWKNFELSYAKALYTTNDDSLSKADVRCLNSNLELVDSKKVIAENFKENWGVSIFADEEGNVPGDAVCLDAEDEDRTDEQIQREEGERATSLVDTTRSNYMGAFLSGNVGKDDDIGLPKDSANVVGICQRNPSLFGGPHGYTSSPYTVQSYFETNSVLLRNAPRIAPCELSSSSSGIWSEKQIYKTEDYFKSQGGPTDDKRYEFKGCEKFFTQNSARGEKFEGGTRTYEHSFKDGLDYLRNGFYSPGAPAVAKGVKQVMSKYHKEYIEHADPVYAEDSDGHYIYDSDGNRVVSHYNYYTTYEYPTYDKNGRFIYYQDGGSYDGGFRNCRVKSEDQWYFNWYGDRGSCASNSWNKTPNSYYRRVKWKRGTWKGDYYSNEARWGKTLIPFEKEYTQYRLHSLPEVHWTLHKVDRNIIVGWKPVHWWWRLWNWFGFTHVEPEPILERRTVWELNFPDGHNYGAEFQLVGGGDSSEKDVEQIVREKMIDMFGAQAGKPCHLIYCASDRDRESYSDFQRRGVDTFLYAKTYTATCFSTIVRHVVEFGACGRRRDRWITQNIQTRFIGVDLDSGSNIEFTGLRKPGFRGNLNGSNLLDKIRRANIKANEWQGRTNIPSPENLSHQTSPIWAFNNVAGRSEYKTHGLEGYGILSCIPGILPKPSELGSDDYFLSYTQYLGQKNLASDTSLMNIPLQTYELGMPQAIGEWEEGVRFFDTAHTPPVISNMYRWQGETHYQSLPRHIVTSWMKACTSGTFYIDEQFKYTGTNFPYLTSFWRVPIDTSFRLFYHQALYQVGFLNILKRIFGTKIVDDYAISFKNIKKLIISENGEPGVCGQRVYDLSSPTPKTTTIDDKSVPTTEVIGYNQWIKEAREIFEPNPEKAQKDFIESIDRRIAVYNVFIEYFEKKSLLDAHCYSWNMIKFLEDAMIDIYKDVNKNQYIERVLYAYMNVLYEYRRYFINKRCNKMDGTLWMIRSLESALPLILASIETTPPKDIGKLGDGSGVEKVALYSFQNSNSMKLNSMSKGLNTKFSEDRISHVYIKVRYATKKDYDSEQLAIKDALAKGEIIEPNIIEVNKWEPKRTEGGRLLFEGNTVARELTGEKVYIYKPINGNYRLESREYLNNLSKINKAKTLYPTAELDANGNIKDEDIIRKLRIKDFDTAIWNIDWNSTDIIFGVIDDIDLPKAIEALEAIPDMEIDDFVCICEKKSDYWDVPVTCNLPRPNGYKSEIKIKLYANENPNSDTSPKEVIHPFTNSICPITETQKYGGLQPEDIIRLHMSHDSLLQAENLI